MKKVELTVSKKINGNNVEWKKEDENKLKKLFGKSMEEEIKKLI